MSENKKCAAALLAMTHRDLMALAEHLSENFVEERALQHETGPTEVSLWLLSWADSVMDTEDELADA